MPALKLFVSHSSRLDDADTASHQDSPNLALLKETCRAIKDKYGARVQVLVDYDLNPGGDWNHYLNLWLAECHVAIILFSKRALEKSAWVAKEATILSWRADLDKSFRLIPVMLAGETTPEDLEKVCSGALQIGRYQCIANARTAQDILEGVINALGEPEQLAQNHALTPLDILQEGIATILIEATESSLERAVEAVCGALPSSPCGIKGYAGLLARQFLHTAPENPPTCFTTFEKGLGPLAPRPSYPRALELFKHIRCLWVEPADVAYLRLAEKHRHPLAMSGCLISWADRQVLKTENYTLERFIERAWPGKADTFQVVPLARAESLGQIKEAIWQVFLGGGPLPPGPNAEKIRDETVNRDVRTIVLLILAHPDQGGLPDPVFLSEMNQLFVIYHKIMLLFDVGQDRPTLPANVKSAQPRLEDTKALEAFMEHEYEAFCGERAAKTYLDNTFGASP